jgi:hypothetical protein
MTGEDDGASGSNSGFDKFCGQIEVRRISLDVTKGYLILGSWYHRETPAMFAAVTAAAFGGVVFALLILLSARY